MLIHNHTIKQRTFKSNIARLTIPFNFIKDKTKECTNLVNNWLKYTVNIDAIVKLDANFNLEIYEGSYLNDDSIFIRTSIIDSQLIINVFILDNELIIEEVCQ